MSLGDHQSPLLDVALQRAIIHHQASRLAEAEQSYRNILRTTPNCPDANHNLGILMVQQGRVDVGLPHLRAALEGNPAKGQYWLSYAENLLTSGEARGALAVLQQAKRCGFLESAINPLMSRAQDAMRSGVSDSDGATFLLSVDDRALNIKPDFAEAHNTLGTALLQLGKLDAAVTSYRRALALRPDIAEVHSNLGWTLCEQGRLEEAEAACRRAIAIAPDYARAHATLGRILWNNNRVKEGFRSFTRSAELLSRASCKVPSNEPIVPHKSRHDQEQRDYLTGIGISANGASDIFHLADDGQLTVPALNAENTNDEISERWLRDSPKIVVIDDFLTNEALDSLRRFCWGSTVWREVYKEGYLGAFSKIRVCLPLARPDRGRTSPRVP